jgi:hypothetical protein
LEPRSAHRGGPRVQIPADAGKVVVSDVAVRFWVAARTSSGASTRCSMCGSTRAESSSRSPTGSSSQVCASLTARASLLASIGWAAALSGGADLTAAQSTVEAIRLALLQRTGGSRERVGRPVGGALRNLSGRSGEEGTRERSSRRRRRSGRPRRPHCPDATRSRDRADSPDLAGPRVICGRRQSLTADARRLLGAVDRSGRVALL